MPLIVQDPNILRAARQAIEVLLRFKGQPVVLVRRGVPVAVGGGGHDFTGDTNVASQKFALSHVGVDELLDGADGDTPVYKRTYALTGRYNADIRIHDKWADAEATYEVEAVDQTSGYKTHADVVGFVKVS